MTKKIDFVRIAAILVIALGILYFYLNIFLPSSIPKSLRIGIIRKPINILILGTDITYDAVTHKPMPRLKGRADTILLVHIDPIHWRMNILSIPRDTYLSIAGHEMQRINVANAYGGASLVKQSVSALTLQKIDYFIAAKPTAVTKLVNLLGGVYLFVEEDMHYVDRVQNFKNRPKKGRAEAFRKTGPRLHKIQRQIRGDIGRIERQQIFFKALGKTLTSPTNIFKAPFAIRSALQEVETDLSLALTIRILNLSRMLSSEDIRTTMLPGEVSFVKGVGSVWITDKEALKKTIREFF